MKNRFLIATFLLLLFTTISFKEKIIFSNFNLKEIQIENNLLMKDDEIKELLEPIYNKNLLFLSNSFVEQTLMKNSLIESFNIKKKYPNTLKVKIFEKKPIAILINKKKKFYLSEKIDLIEFRELKNYNNLPYVFGNKDEFEILFYNLKKMNFPTNLIKKYTLYEANRWDLETIEKKIIKLPTKNYVQSLENFMTLKDKSDVEKYKVFDYRVDNQLILK